MWDGARSPDVLLVITMDESVYGVWFIAIPEHEQDWLCHIARNDDDTYTMTYRHRYYKDDKSFDSTDEKSWHVASGQLEGLLTCVQMAQSSAVLLFGAENLGMYRLLREDKTFEEFMEEFKKMPFVHSSKTIGANDTADAQENCRVH